MLIIIMIMMMIMTLTIYNQQDILDKINGNNITKHPSSYIYIPMKNLQKKMVFL